MFFKNYFFIAYWPAYWQKAFLAASESVPAATNLPGPDEATACIVKEGHSYGDDIKSDCSRQGNLFAARNLAMLLYWTCLQSISWKQVFGSDGVSVIWEYIRWQCTFSNLRYQNQWPLHGFGKLTTGCLVVQTNHVWSKRTLKPCLWIPCFFEGYCVVPVFSWRILCCSTTTVRRKGPEALTDNTDNSWCVLMT